MEVLFSVLLKLFALTLIVQANEMSQLQVNNFIQDVLVSHNKLRDGHDVPKLKLNAQLNKIAYEQAMKYSESVKLTRPKYRQTLLGVNKVTYEGARNFTGKDFSNYLYEKGKNFDYTLESIQNAGSFTQLVWKSSTDIGVGVCKLKNTLYIVALYFPPGNVVGEAIKNVQPPIFKKSSTLIQKSTKSNIKLLQSTKYKKLFATNAYNENNEMDLKWPKNTHKKTKATKKMTKTSTTSTTNYIDDIDSQFTTKKFAREKFSDENEIIDNSDDFYSKL